MYIPRKNSTFFSIHNLFVSRLPVQLLLIWRCNQGDNKTFCVFYFYMFRTKFHLFLTTLGSYHLWSKYDKLLSQWYIFVLLHYQTWWLAIRKNSFAQSFEGFQEELLVLDRENSRPKKTKMMRVISKGRWWYICFFLFLFFILFLIFKIFFLFFFYWIRFSTPKKNKTFCTFLENLRLIIINIIIIYSMTKFPI